MAIRLVLADDHPLILSGLERLFETAPDCEVLARCANGQEALDAVRRHRPDVLILDSRMPLLDGLEVLRLLASEASPTHAVLLAESAEEDLIRDAIQLGVRGVVFKEMPPDTLLQCVRKVRGGGYWLERRSAAQALDELMRREAASREIAGLLTRREQEVLLLVCRGLRNKEVADSLSISESTAKAHLQHIFQKMHVKGRLALLRHAEVKGWSDRFIHRQV
ncbi:MAG TPA: response regulator transcription factor [Thermoanaerobaculia bacterium]|nr:response regulator transcription factor [Thermoanaerobaculia bacterium]